MVVNFYSFTQISDALGGVYQYFPTPARDLYSDLGVGHAGCVLLKGSQALAFVRSREYQYYLNGSWQYQLVPESDLARIQRQQAFVKLAIKKAEAVGPTNPLALNTVIGGVIKSLSVDTGFSDSLILSMAKVLRHANAAGIPDWTYPTVNSYDVPGALAPGDGRRPGDGEAVPRLRDAGDDLGHSHGRPPPDVLVGRQNLGRRRLQPGGGWRSERPQRYAGLPGRDRLLVVLRGPVHTARAPAGADATEVPVLVSAAQWDRTGVSLSSSL